MIVNEYRVRPVQRFVVTHYQTDGPGNGAVRTIGEFPNTQIAQEVASAMRAYAPVEPMVSGVELPRQYAIVSRDFDISAVVLYADTEDEAEATKSRAEAEYGGEFRIFSRAIDDAPPRPVLVVKSYKCLSREQLDVLAADVERQAPGHRVLVVDKSVDVAAIAGADTDHCGLAQR